MTLKEHLEEEKRKLESKPIEGYTEETFVVGYKGHSQMDTNTINGLDVSARGVRMLEEIYGKLKEEDKEDSSQ